MNFCFHTFLILKMKSNSLNEVFCVLCSNLFLHILFFFFWINLLKHLLWRKEFGNVENLKL